MEYHIAMTESINSSLQKFLLKDLKDEEICFAVWYPAQGSSRLTILLHEIVFPKHGERKRHGTVSALPHYVDRIKELARIKGGGVVMIHTHPLGRGPQGVSYPDLYYEQDILSREIFGITGLPLVGMTLAGDGMWSARIYPKPYKIQWCSCVRIVGKNLIMHYNSDLKPTIPSNEKQVRTTSVWKEKIQGDIMRLSVGIIGVGSVGAAVGEILARVGVGKIIALDYDTLKIHNLDRMTGASEEDLGKRKIDIVKRNLVKSSTNDEFSYEGYNYSIVEEDGYQKALDCDVIFSCVDRPWPRQVLNHLSYSCLIPIIDGGVSFRINNNKLIHGMFRAQTIGPERVCLSCLHALDTGEIQLDRHGLFDDPEYISKLDSTSRLKSRENIMPFVSSLAGLETIQFIELVTNLGKRGDLGQQAYDYRTGEIIPFYKHCENGCEYNNRIALGDTCKPHLEIDKARLREMNNN